MRKYWAVAKVTWANAVIYPMRIWGTVLISSGSIAVYMFLWLSLFKETNNIGGYSLSAMLTYYVLTFVMREMTVSGTTAFEISRNIGRGELSSYLIKPVSYVKYVMAKLVADKIIRTLLMMGIMLIITSGTDWLVRPHNLFWFGISAVLSMFICYFIHTMIGTVAFWTINVWGITSVLWRTTDVLNGSVFPLDLLPGNVQTIMGYLPFRYMHYLPVSIYLGRIENSQILGQISMQVVWLMILGVVARQFWLKGLKQYDSVGN